MMFAHGKRKGGRAFGCNFNDFGEHNAVRRIFRPRHAGVSPSGVAECPARNGLTGTIQRVAANGDRRSRV